MDQVLTGPAARHLLEGTRATQRDLTQKCGPDRWQFESVALLNESLCLVVPSHEKVNGNQDLRRWFREFAELRNKTTGHGAPPLGTISAICPRLEQSLLSLIDNFELFQRQWVYLHRNLSGKYRVTKLAHSADAFDRLKSTTSEMLPDGVYVDYGEPARVELADSDVEATDFFLANGAFNEKTFELLSYLSGDVIRHDATPYVEPIGPLPESETHGLTGLELIGRAFTNLPSRPKGYIRRRALEQELSSVLTDDRHPIVTLVGRGGIGKTSLALTVVHDLLKEGRFDIVVWFSARDLDLLQEGPKTVAPRVLTAQDVADEYVRLVEPSDAKERGFRPLDFFAAQLAKSSVGPTLFVFDNFETLSRPLELYKWLDTHIRLPNKILITTRQREFKADYPIDVRGMNESEAEQLIDATAEKLGISSLLSRKYRQELFHESDGHPYVIKILLGEVAKAKQPRVIERIVADSGEILIALFERTYSGLSPGAQRVFLTLCNWRATIPKLAVEAVLLRPKNERIAVEDCLSELEQSSFIEILQSPADGQLFIDTPLVAAVFGRRKLVASPFKSAVDSDTELLQYFGAGRTTDIGRGVAPRIERFVMQLAGTLESGKERLVEHGPMLEYIGRQYPPAWKLFAGLYQEASTTDAFEKAKKWLRFYLESQSGRSDVESWRNLAKLCRATGDVTGELHALVAICDLPDVGFTNVSFVANRFNEALSENRESVDFEERQVLADRIARVMEGRILEGNATDRSRLAWLYVRLNDLEKAKEHILAGLEIEPGNLHCQKLASRLGLRL
jgi:hypothetical protein